MLVFCKWNEINFPSFLYECHQFLLVYVFLFATMHHFSSHVKIIQPMWICKSYVLYKKLCFVNIQLNDYGSYDMHDQSQD